MWKFYDRVFQAIRENKIKLQILQIGNEWEFGIVLLIELFSLHSIDELRNKHKRGLSVFLVDSCYYHDQLIWYLLHCGFMSFVTG